MPSLPLSTPVLEAAFRFDHSCSDPVHFTPDGKAKVDPTLPWMTSDLVCAHEARTLLFDDSVMHAAIVHGHDEMDRPAVQFKRLSTQRRALVCQVLRGMKKEGAEEYSRADGGGRGSVTKGPGDGKGTAGGEKVQVGKVNETTKSVAAPAAGGAAKSEADGEADWEVLEEGAGEEGEYVIVGR
ncbi:hypothetical protein LTR37_019099 [Vermiconidia calcicola]|uniref:Uncharacterized protein n=1 Tax=Vermiconidia calcicola TaxID=1690605 RepID=A0ACC3MF77_9PEZI|nr:hypothetical protein LTR37_019099 [Vermiconidia calcicola]